MTLSIYKISQLMAAAKAVIRGAVSGVGTEDGTDFDLSLNAAARLLQGTQVAGASVYEQLDPKTANAQRRDDLVDQLGLVFEREATPARGLIAVTYQFSLETDFTMVAGTEIVFPGELFGDGVERTYRTLSDVVHTSVDTFWQLTTGTGIRKLLPKTVLGSSLLHARTMLYVQTDAGTDAQYAFVRASSPSDQSVDLALDIRGVMNNHASNHIITYVHNCVVEAECTTPGVVGNAPHVFNAFTGATTDVDEAPLAAIIVEMSGGGDAVGVIDGNTERVVRLIEDTIAMPPSFGNPQHWREIALACPDVDLDDAIVYQHVRGRGTVDIVAIGRSGGIRASAFPDCNLGYVFWGNNQRRIGEAQAFRLQAWVNSKASYFDDILVRAVDWDFRGNLYANDTSDAFIQASNAMLVEVEAQDGFGTDCGVALDVTPATRHATRLYPPVGDTEIDASLKAGQRVWATVAHAKSDVRHPFATVVTEILSIAGDRTYAAVADVSGLGPGEEALDGADLVVLRWGAAGPLTQPCLDAVFAYFDALGPGSYSEAPRGPSYVQHFNPATLNPPVPGVGVTRWPPEGRRWSSSLRAAELRAAVMAIDGVRSVRIAVADDSDQTVDFEPGIFRTLALTGAVVTTV